MRELRFQHGRLEAVVENSEKVLVVAGMLALLYASLLGLAMAQARMKAPQAPRHLVTTHLEGLILGAALLGLVLALELSDLPRGLEVTAAVITAVGGASSLIGGTLNWRHEVGDQFAARSLGFRFQAVAGPAILAGLVIIFIG